MLAKGCKRCMACMVQAAGRAVTATDAVHRGLLQRCMAATPASTIKGFVGSTLQVAVHGAGTAVFENMQLTVGCLAG